MTLPQSPTPAHAPSTSSSSSSAATRHDPAPLLSSTAAAGPTPTTLKPTRTITQMPPSLLAPPALINATPYHIPPPLPAAAYYIPSFITPHEEAAIVAAVNAVPERRWVHLARRRLQVYPCPVTDKGVLVVGNARDLDLPEWVEGVAERLSRVRLSGGRGVFAAEHDATGVERDGGKGGEEPGVVNSATEATAARRPNHCLVNEYRPGQGISMHEDGPAYIPIVATVTLGSYGVLDVVRKDRRCHASSAAVAAGEVDAPSEMTGAMDADANAADDAAAPWRILQERRSLLISTADVYTQCLHGIETTDRDEDLFGWQDGRKRIVNAELLGAGRAGRSGERSSDGGTAAEEEEEEEEEAEGKGEGQDTFEAGIGVRGTRVSLTFRFVRKTKVVGKAMGYRFGGGGAGR